MTDEHAQDWMRWLARGCVVLMLVVTGASAWLRLAQPRPVCGDWPACRAAAPGAPQLATPEPPAAAVAVVRGLHRVAASTTLVLLLALLVLARRHRSVCRGALPLVAALLALALGLSALGVATPGSRSSAVVLGNLLGGFAMLVLSWALVRRLGGAVPVNGATRRAAGAALALGLVQAALGGASGGGAAGELAAHLHALLGFAVATVAMLVGLVLWRSPLRREGRALLVLALGQLVLGAATAAQGAPVALALLHNLLAVVALALLGGLALARG